MAYTTPTPYWETSASPPDSHTAAKEFATFLNGRHATQPNGAVWKIIDCYDGTTREQPTNGDSANLSASNKWREDQGVPPQNAWIVWQAPAGGDVAARFQVYMEMTTFTSVFFGMFMLNDWSVGAGTDSNPDIPATSLGAPAFAGGDPRALRRDLDAPRLPVLPDGHRLTGPHAPHGDFGQARAGGRDPAPLAARALERPSGIRPVRSLCDEIRARPHKSRKASCSLDISSE